MRTPSTGRARPPTAASVQRPSRPCLHQYGPLADDLTASGRNREILSPPPSRRAAVGQAREIRRHRQAFNHCDVAPLKRKRPCANRPRPSPRLRLPKYDAVVSSPGFHASMLYDRSETLDPGRTCEPPAGCPPTGRRRPDEAGRSRASGPVRTAVRQNSPGLAETGSFGSASRRPRDGEAKPLVRIAGRPTPHSLKLRRPRTYEHATAFFNLFQSAYESHTLARHRREGGEERATDGTTDQPPGRADVISGPRPPFWRRRLA